MKTTNIILKSVLLFIFVLLADSSRAQWEKIYFSTRIGLRTNLQSSQPDQPNFRYLSSPEGRQELYPNDYFKDAAPFYYVGPSFNAGVYFNVDANHNGGCMNTWEQVGLSVGIEYVTQKLKAKYYTADEGHWLEESNCLTGIGLPVAYRFGALGNKQIFGFVGWQYQFNFRLRQIQKVDWSDKVLVRKSTVYDRPAEITQGNHVFFVGFTAKYFSLQLDYMPRSFMNVDYLDVEGNLIYANQRGNILSARLFFNMPFQNSFINRHPVQATPVGSF